MSCRKGIAVAFRRLGEAAQSIQLPQMVEALFSARQHLVNIRLMSNVPDNFILRQMKAVFQCYSQLHNAQIGRKMSSCFGYLLQKEPPQLFAKLL